MIYFKHSLYYSGASVVLFTSNTFHKKRWEVFKEKVYLKNPEQIHQNNLQIISIINRKAKSS